MIFGSTIDTDFANEFKGVFNLSQGEQLEDHSTYVITVMSSICHSQEPNNMIRNFIEARWETRNSKSLCSVHLVHIHMRQVYLRTPHKIRLILPFPRQL